MKQFVLTLGEESTIELVFDLLDSDIAHRWAREIDADYPLYETTRFKGWNTTKDLNYYITEINKQLSILDMEARFVSTQDDLNNLHKIFEVLRGPVDVGTDYYNTAPLEIQQSINTLNILIHECEHYTRYSTLYPELICTYQNRPRYPLIESDYELFTCKWKFGYVYINYCEVGKPILDVFKDNDVIVGDDNIRPLEYYSADFLVKFGPDTTDEEYNIGYEKFNNWLSKQQYSFKHLSVGAIPVAKLNTTFTPEEVINKISNHLKVKATCLR